MICWFMCLCSPVRLSLPCSYLQQHSGWLIKATPVELLYWCYTGAIVLGAALEPLYWALLCSFLCDNPRISQSRLQVNAIVSRTSKLKKLRLNGFFNPRGQTETQNCTVWLQVWCALQVRHFSLHFWEWRGGAAGGWMLLVQAFSCLLVSLAPG